MNILAKNNAHMENTSNTMLKSTMQSKNNALCYAKGCTHCTGELCKEASKSTNRRVSLNIGGIDTAQLLSIAACQGVHCIKAQVETSGSSINSQNIHGSLQVARGIGQSVALAAVWIVPAGDGRGTTDVGEGWERAKGGIASGEQTVCAVRA